MNQLVDEQVEESEVEIVGLTCEVFVPIRVPDGVSSEHRLALEEHNAAHAAFCGDEQ